MPVVLPDGGAHKVQVEVVKVAYKVERMVEVAALLLALLAQQRGQIEIPCQNLVLALLGHVARRHQLRIYRLGAKLQRPQQILQLPQVEYVLRNVLLAFRLCYIHILELQ